MWCTIGLLAHAGPSRIGKPLWLAATAIDTILILALAQMMQRIVRGLRSRTRVGYIKAALLLVVTIVALVETVFLLCVVCAPLL